MYIITGFLIIHASASYVKILFLFLKESERLSMSNKCQQLHVPLLKCTLVTTETKNVRWASATSAKCMIWLRVILLAAFHQNSAESSSEEDEKRVKIKCFQWEKNDEGFLSKIQMVHDVDDALSLWQKHVTRMKRHMFTKRQQHEVYVNLKEGLSTNEMIVHLDYSENYKSTQQNEIQSAYFGNTLFSLFTIMMS